MNGQAKIDFEKWLIDYYLINRNDYNQFSNEIILRKHYRKTMVEQHSLIIEWFDSIGIYISVNKMELLSGFSYSIIDKIKGFGGKELTRQQATEKALEQAIIMYNEKFKENE